MDFLKLLACKYEELKQSDMKAVVVGRTSIVLVRSQDDSIYALRNVCPHKGPCLSDGMIDRGCSSERAGEYIYDGQTELLRCPWHSWEFDIKTGKSVINPEHVKVKTYAVTVEDGNVYVDIERSEKSVTE
ncbi:MAG: (2Fe-2S)-binding protein [Paenibacillus sp.]|jgi:nitrite reductase/ring-hydroxylating ferredoxin subunit|nr:(2Fe-2S)-binding protein [Paenibacillus sp.]